MRCFGGCPSGSPRDPDGARARGGAPGTASAEAAAVPRAVPRARPASGAASSVMVAIPRAGLQHIGDGAIGAGHLVVARGDAQPDPRMAKAADADLPVAGD